MGRGCGMDLSLCVCAGVYVCVHSWVLPGPVWVCLGTWGPSICYGTGRHLGAAGQA